MDKFLRSIHGGFDAQNEIEPNMYHELLRLMNEASVQGLSFGNFSIEHNREFLQAIKHSNEVFSAFKTHRMGVSMQARLLDDKGNLKSFSQWKNDVKSIASHHVGTWLQTEYNTAVLRAHNAADWREFLANKDILPNLRWMPTTSPDAEATHRGFWEKKLTLPVEHPFWNKHHPGDRWNCKCALEATDEPASPDDVLEDIPDIKPQAGLENNPGKDGHLISDKHPYFPKSCNSCAFNKKSGIKNRIKSWFVNQEKNCNNCEQVNRRIRYNYFLQPMRNEILNQEITSNEIRSFPNLRFNRISHNRNTLKRLLSHARTITELNAARYIWNNPSELEFIRRNPFGEGKDFNNPVDQRNLQKKWDRGIRSYVTYKFQYRGQNFLIKTERHRGNFEQFYHIQKMRSPQT